MTKEQKDLILKIEDAWQSVKYPGDKKISVPDTYDDEGTSDYFSGTTWKEHTIDNLRRYNSAISSFFTPIAWHYWLPAYLMAAVEDVRKLDVGFSSVIYSLKRDRLDFEKRLKLLTSEQTEVFIQVLEFTITDDDRDSHSFYTSDHWKLLEYFYKRANN